MAYPDHVNFEMNQSLLKSDKVLEMEIARVKSDDADKNELTEHLEQEAYNITVCPSPEDENKNNVSYAVILFLLAAVSFYVNSESNTSEPWINLHLVVAFWFASNAWIYRNACLHANVRVLVILLLPEVFLNLFLVLCLFGNVVWGFRVLVASSLVLTALTRVLGWTRQQGQERFSEEEGTTEVHACEEV